MVLYRALVLFPMTYPSLAVDSRHSSGSGPRTSRLKFKLNFVVGWFLSKADEMIAFQCLLVVVDTRSLVSKKMS
jgi:hypothetical protein